MNQIGERIAHLRKLYRLTQAGLAENLCGVTDKTVSKWECGDSEPSTSDIVAVAEYFKVTLDYLISGKISPQDKIVLDRQPTEEELLSDAKAEWIKKCNAIIRNNTLQKYREKIFPASECEKYREGIDYGEGCTDCGVNIGIFRQVVVEKGKCFDVGIDLKQLLSFDDYELFDKVVSLNIPFYSGRDRRRFFCKNEIISEKDIHGLTDTRFYALLNHQGKLIEASVKYEGFSMGRFRKDYKLGKDDDFEEKIYRHDCYRKELNKALENLEKSNPHYWEIVKVLIEEGAYIQKVVGQQQEYDGDSWTQVLRYDDDFLQTELVYELAKKKLSKQ